MIINPLKVVRDYKSLTVGFILRNVLFTTIPKRSTLDIKSLFYF